LQYASGHIWGGQETILRRLVVGDRKTGVAGINADTLLFSHSLGPKRRKTMSVQMSAVGELSGLNMLALSLAADDPRQTPSSITEALSLEAA
jgi:hypothetical protein